MASHHTTDGVTPRKALSEIPAVHDFGLLSAFLVIANYILLVTLMLSSLTIWHVWIRPYELRLLSCLPACIRPVTEDGVDTKEGGYRQNRQEYEIPEDIPNGVVPFNGASMPACFLPPGKKPPYLR